MSNEFRYWMTNAPVGSDLPTTDTSEWLTNNVRLVIVHDEMIAEQKTRWAKHRGVAVAVDA